MALIRLFYLVGLLLVVVMTSACDDDTDVADSGSDSDTDSDTDGDAGPDGSTDPVVTRVSAGMFHSCVVFENGNVKCWGYDQFGPLGYGPDLESYPDADEFIPSTLPFVNVGANVVEIEASNYFTCALLEGGEVLCWGSNSDGQLGQGHGIVNIPSPSEYDPIDVGGPVLQMDTGGAHVCALLEGGGLKCWGLGWEGQLGYGSTAPVYDPSEKGLLDLGGPSIDVSAGARHTCAVLEGGGVKCWGNNDYGQLGYGTTDSVLAPSEVGTLPLGTSAVQVSAGSEHTCALLVGGEIKCWGMGSHGELGYGNTDSIGDNETLDDLDVVDVGGDVVQVSAGSGHTCAILDDSSVRCWGGIEAGLFETIGDDETPATAGEVPVGGLVVELSSGYRHVCAVLNAGTVRCWGSANSCQLGYGYVDPVEHECEDICDDETPADAGDVPLF